MFITILKSLGQTYEEKILIAVANDGMGLGIARIQASEGNEKENTDALSEKMEFQRLMSRKMVVNMMASFGPLKDKK